MIVHDCEELVFYHRRVTDPIIQEFIEGKHYSIDIFNNEQQQPICIVPRIRLKVDGAVSVLCKIDMDVTIIE